MKRPYKVRFNLGAGKNYMKWKVEGPEGVVYYSPDEIQIVMSNCQLKNQRKTAQKILEGAHKTVCAWIKCEHLVIKAFNIENLVITENKAFDEESVIQLKYNPRVLPNWFINEGENADNMIVTTVFSSGRKLFALAK
jgi:hypothetical protein